MLEQIKRQAWIQPWMPRLRVLRREWENLKNLPQLQQEEKASRSWTARLFAGSAQIEAALSEVRQAGGYFGGWALSRSALRTLSACLFSRRDKPLIVEWGSGQSTLFWAALQKQLPLRFVGIEHDPYWFRHLQARVPSGPDFKYLCYPLKQLSPAEREALWQAPDQADALFQQSGAAVPESENSDTRLPNAFYAVDCSRLFAPSSIDGMVLDGPNGNGRSIAFALLRPYLKPDAWILIDDFDHYDFLADLGRIYDYELKHVQINAGKRWCLVELQPPSNAPDEPVRAAN